MNKESERKLALVDNDSFALPAYFLSMKIKHYRCFGPEQTLNLSSTDGIPAQWTIILGDNGVGKTTLLQCLAAAQPERLRSRRTNINHISYIISNEGMGTFDLYANAFFPVGNSGFLIEYNIYCGKNISNQEPFTETAKLAIYNKTEEPDVSANLTGTDTNIERLLIYGYGANRRISKSSLSETKPGSNSGSLLSDDVHLLNAEEWLLHADYAAIRSLQNNNRAAKQRDQIIAVLIDILPEVEDIKCVVSEDDGAVVAFKTPYGWVSLRKLSLGYQTLVTWMVDLASRLFERYPDSPNPLAEPAIVLVDEIDLHLHPRWQRTLMQFLTEKFPNTQFIATAHSPLVVQSAVDANIVLLRREGDHVVIDNDVETIKNWRVDQILTSELFGL